MDKSAVIKQVLSPRVSASVSLILLLLLMMVLASVFWSAAAFNRDVTLPVSRPVAAVAQSAGGPQYNVQSLLAVPLFGEAPQDDSEKVIQQDVQRSRLKISVLGLVSGSDESGVAILRHGSKTKAYSVGEKIEVAGSVTLLAVMSDHIIIENNRRQEKIELEKRQLSGGITAAPSASAQPAGREAHATRSRPTQEKEAIWLGKGVALMAVCSSAVSPTASACAGRAPGTADGTSSSSPIAHSPAIVIGAAMRAASTGSEAGVNAAGTYAAMS